MRQIRLGGLEFDGGPGDVPITVERDALQGWIGKGGPGVRRQDKPRPLAHGSFYQRGFRTGRLITWHGLIKSRSPEEQDHKLARLAGVLADGEQGRMEVDSAMGTHWCDVQLDDEPDVKVLLYGHLASYSIGVWSNEPEVYGDTRRFGPGKVYQRGSFRSIAEAFVPGPVAAPYTLALNGRQFVVSQALGAGQMHRLDTRNGRIYRDGIRQHGAITRAQSLIVKPGAEQTFTGPPGTQLIVTDALI